MALPVDEIRLIDGTALDDKQKEAWTKLQGMLQTTISTGKLQVPPKKKEKENPDHAKAAEVFSTDATLQKWADGFTIRRYLVANKWDVNNAYNACMGTISYRSTTLALTLTQSVSDPFLDINNACYMQWLGHDRDGFPALFIRSRNADLKIPRARRLQYLEIALARGVQLMTAKWGGKDGIEQWNMIIDETDKEMKHMDNKFVKQISPILFGHYVERLRHCYIINAGVLTKAVLAIVKLMMDERTKSKIHSYSREKQVDERPDGTKIKTYSVPKLLAALGPENTPIEYGGTLKTPSTEEYLEFYNSIEVPSPVDVEHAKNIEALKESSLDAADGDEENGSPAGSPTAGDTSNANGGEVDLELGNNSPVPNSPDNKQAEEKKE